MTDAERKTETTLASAARHPGSAANAVTVATVWAAAPAAPTARARTLPRLQATAAHVVPYLQYRLARLGATGQMGLATLGAAAIIAVTVLLPGQRALQTMSEELARARHAPAPPSVAQVAPRLLASLPTRSQVPGVIGKVYAEAKAAGVSLDTGHYLYTPPKGQTIARYDLEFPVKAGYPDIRSFIDRTLAAVPAAALGKLRVERKAVGDAVVMADIDFVLFVRGGAEP